MIDYQEDNGQDFKESETSIDSMSEEQRKDEEERSMDQCSCTQPKSQFSGLMTDDGEESRASDLELLVKEIESSGGSCANVIRKLLERSAERGESAPDCDDFFDLMDSRLKEQDQEIERMCNYHYQAFVNSTNEVLQVQSDAELLRESLNLTNDTVLSSVRALQEKAKELSKCRVALDNIERGSSALQMCLPVLDMYLRLQKKIEEGRCYPALKMLEHLKHNLLPLVSKYRFADFIESHLPSLRAEIERRGERELTDFLTEVSNSLQFGAIAMRQVARQHGLGMSTGASFAAILSGRGSVSDSRRVNGDDTALEEDIRATLQASRDEVGAVDELIDFGPLYRRLHIAQVLGEREKFERQYQRTRARQCGLVLHPTSQQHQESMTVNYGEYFSRIVGFFVIDEYVHHTLPRLVTSEYLADTWHKAGTAMVDAVEKLTGRLEDTDALLNLKDYCLLFGLVMSSFGFNTTYTVNEMVGKVRCRYDLLVGKRLKQRFAEIVRHDDYTAIYLENQEQYDELLKEYPCATAEFDALPFPKRLPFSGMVPKIYVSLRDYIDVCLEFARNVDLSETELNHQIAKAANVFFMESLRCCLITAIREGRPSLLPLIQLSVNMDELEIVSNKLEEYIRQRVSELCASSSSPHSFVDGTALLDESLALHPRRGPQTTSSHTPETNSTSSKLSGVSLFRDIRSEAENQIYVTLNAKIDVFIDVNMYDWTAEDTGSPHRFGSGRRTWTGSLGPEEVSQDVADLIEFLTNNFKSFTHLPPKVAQTACLSSCKYIAGKLMSFLTSCPQVRLLSRAALHQMERDVRACEDFARAEPVPGVDGATLLMAFKDLRQLVDLVLAEDWTTYLNEQRSRRLTSASNEQSVGPPTVYDRVTPGAVIRVLEKVREWDKKKGGILTGLTRVAREKRKRMEDVSRQLKELQTAAYSS